VTRGKKEKPKKGTNPVRGIGGGGLTGGLRGNGNPWCREEGFPLGMREADGSEKGARKMRGRGGKKRRPVVGRIKRKKLD